ncbi:MAG: methyl-accepting chemotaxis protein [Deltaproteobacteria bacterium]|nr:methyl-accepting chemotaxis protein [Deltaproteobacteria bacterium]
MKNPSLVSRVFKLRFGLKLCLITIAGVVAAGEFLFFLTSKDLSGSYSQSVYAIYALKIKIFPLIFASFYSLAILGVVAGAIAVISMFFSHKIAGPLFRLERSMEAIGKGDLTVGTFFRQKDQLVPLAEEINAMVRSLNHTARSCSDALSDIKRSEDRLYELLKAEPPPEKEIAQTLIKIKTGIEGLKRASSTIKVKEG